MTDIVDVPINFVSAGVIVALLIVGLIAWFYINRASVRASEQIRLLETLLYEQKKQKVLLRQLADALNNSGAKRVPDSGQEKKGNDKFTHLIPER